MNELDWSWFAPGRRRPPRSMRCVLSETGAVFRAAAKGGASLKEGRELPGVLFRIFVDNAEVRAGEKELLPTAADETWPSYADRVTRMLGGRKFGLLINNIQTLSPELFAAANNFLAGYQKLNGAAGTVRLTAFMGTYAQTAFGPHTDPGHTDVFQFVIEGKKRMCCWDSELVARTTGMAASLESSSDYSAWLPLASTIEGGAGTLLYWPGTSWHVGEVPDERPHISLSLVISKSQLSARRFFHGAIDDVLDTFGDQDSSSSSWSSLLEHLAREAETLKLRATKRALSASSRRGWEYPLPSRDSATLSENEVIKKSATSFLWQPHESSILIAALGNILEVTRDPDVEQLLTAIDDGEPHRVGDLLDVHTSEPEDRDAIRGLLEELYRDRAFDKIAEAENHV